MSKLFDVIKKIIAGSTIIILDGLFKYLVALAQGGTIDWIAAFTGPEIQVVLLFLAWQIWETVVRPEIPYETASDGNNGWNFLG